MFLRENSIKGDKMRGGFLVICNGPWKTVFGENNFKCSMIFPVEDRTKTTLCPII